MREFKKQVRPIFYSLIFMLFALNPSLSFGIFGPFSPVLKEYDESALKKGSYLRLDNGNVLYARYSPAKEGQPTVVLMNGLPDSLNFWRQKEPLLIQMGYGVLAFDFRGQDHTLFYHGSDFGDLNWKAQVDDVRALIDFMKLDKVIVSGLSYGGGIAIAFASEYPDRVSKVVAFAPFVEPVEPVDSFVSDKAKMLVNLNLYRDLDQAFESLFRVVVYTTYPLAEPGILLHPYKPEAVLKLALGIRGFKAHEAIKKLPKGSLTLVGGSYDESVTLEILMRLWNATPEEIRQAFMVVETGHRITTWKSEVSAQIIHQVVTNEHLKNGLILDIDEKSNEFFKRRNHIIPITCDSKLLE